MEAAAVEAAAEAVEAAAVAAAVEAAAVEAAVAQQEVAAVAISRPAVGPKETKRAVAAGPQEAVVAPPQAVVEAVQPRAEEVARWARVRWVAAEVRPLVLALQEAAAERRRAAMVEARLPLRAEVAARPVVLLRGPLVRVVVRRAKVLLVGVAARLPPLSVPVAVGGQPERSRAPWPVLQSVPLQAEAAVRRQALGAEVAVLRQAQAEVAVLRQAQAEVAVLRLPELYLRCQTLH